jgi:plastocyanin domain-containing protein
VLVILIGLFSMNNGLVLAGAPFAPTTLLAQIGSTHVPSAGKSSPKIIDGKQVLSMKVVGLKYTPSTFTVVQGIPVEWHIDGSQAEGCAQVLTVPTLGITAYLPAQGSKTVVFVPKDLGDLSFSCPMGMTTPGATLTVVPNTQGIVANRALTASGTGEPAVQGCSSQQSGCHVQKLSAEISDTNGFAPNSFTVRKGMPVELTIDVQTVPAGCMSTMVIPAWNVAHTFTPGKNVLQFTATETGVFPIACSMGTAFGQLTVTD